MRVTTLSVLALAGAVGFAGSAAAKPWDRDNERPVRPDRPEGRAPVGSIRSEIMLHVAHDGRADTGGREARERTEPRARTERPDNNYGQERHIALPIRSDIALRVSLGDGREAMKQPAAKAQPTAEPREVKVYPGRHEHPAAPLPIKADILLQVSGGGEVGVNDTKSDDPKINREQRQAEAHSTKVYPGRHERHMAAPEADMWIHKRQSAQGDQAGDKDAP